MLRPEVRLLQIVPYRPGIREGVGDYALNLARALRRDHGIDTVFAVAHEESKTSIDGFEVEPAFDGNTEARFDHVLLHYVNYAYHHRGIPFYLCGRARQLRARLRGRWLTMFHELYASGPPWRSAFWLRPWQKKIARSMIDISDACFVSNDPIATEIRHYAPRESIVISPILSNFGEPVLERFDDRSPHQWVICGGTALVTRSMGSFRKLIDRIPAWCAPKQLDVIGGTDVPELQRALDELRTAHSAMTIERHADVSAEQGSSLLQRGGFAWIDYFGAGKAWPGMIFKSASFAACCAHAVIPVGSHVEERLGVDGDFLPGPFYLTRDAIRFPDEQRAVATRETTHRWYHRHASSSITASRYAEALR